MNFKNIMLSETSHPYMRHVEEANSWRQKIDQRSPAAGGRENGELLPNGYKVSIWSD